jgi:competence protein ComEA
MTKNMKAMLGIFLGFLGLLVAGPAGAEGRRGGNEAQVATAAAAPAGRAGGEQSGVVNINEASAEQLELLPGIGPSKAKAILDHRKAHPFKRVEELTRIKGIGKKTFARLRPLVSLSGPTSLTERPGRVASRQ